MLWTILRMKEMIRLKTVIVAAILFSNLFTYHVYANCMRHIYNNSEQPWSFTFTTSSGNVYFHDAACNVNGPCLIPPNANVTIEYSHRSGAVEGRVDVMDSNSKAKSFVYYGTGVSNPCPYLSHRGSTGSVGVNDPADGDFTITQNTW